MNRTSQFYFNVCSNTDSPSFIIVTFPSNKYIINQTIVCLVNCVLIIPAILLNGVQLFTILRSPLLKAKVCYFLIAAQSTIDLALATISIPAFTYLIYSEVIGTANCMVIFVLTVVGLVPGGLSLAALCALTFDRYMGILYPIAHRNRVTRRMFFIYFGLFTVMLLTGVPIATTSAIVYYVGMTIVIGASLVLNGIAYIKIFVAVGRRIQPNDNNLDCSVDSNSSKASKRKRFLQELKLAKSCALVVGVFYICYLPGLVISLYYFQTNKLKYRVAHSWYVTNFALNSSLNSIVFFWKRPILRKEALRTLKKLRKLF